jgi:biotin synthase
VQLARHLIIHEELDPGLLSFDEYGRLIGWNKSTEKLKEYIRDNNGRMFMTSGCPGCNRPYYTSSPRGQIYNYPSPLTKDQIEETIKELFSNRGRNEL